MIGEVITATRDHAIDMAPRMRPADCMEVYAASLQSPLCALDYGVCWSTLAWSWVVDGKIACMWGVGGINGSMLDRTGIPWLLSTDIVEQHQKTFLRNYRPYLARMLTVHPVLENYVDARYETAIRWLRWLGFTISDPGAFGVEGQLFSHIELKG